MLPTRSCCAGTASIAVDASCVKKRARPLERNMVDIFKAGRPVLLGLLLAFSAGALQIAHADERYREHEYCRS
jgi:hypothetical protein